MKKKLIYKDEKSHKFWNITVEGAKYIITFGKVDTAGQMREKVFDSAEKALAEAQKNRC